MIKEILDIPQPDDCKHCKPCLRMRLMEMGLIQGEKIDIVSHKLGLWIIHTLSDTGNVTSTIALREDEFDRICLL